MLRISNPAKARGTVEWLFWAEARRYFLLLVLAIAVIIIAWLAAPTVWAASHTQMALPVPFGAGTTTEPMGMQDRFRMAASVAVLPLAALAYAAWKSSIKFELTRQDELSRQEKLGR